MKVSGHLGLRKSRAFDAAGQDGYAHLEVHCHGAALQAKIDELIKATGKARDDLIGLENRGEDDIEQMRVNEDSGAKRRTKRPTPKNRGEKLRLASRVPARYVRFPPKADITEFRWIRMHLTFRTRLPILGLLQSYIDGLRRFAAPISFSRFS